MNGMPQMRAARRWLGACALTLLGAGAAGAADNSFPERPLRLVVGFAPGGGADIVARLVAGKIGARLGQTVVVENRPGATGTIAADNVARSGADGYSLFLGSQSTMVVAPSLFPKLPFDPVKDFAPVSQMVSMPLVLVVNPALVPGQTVAELDAQIRKAGDGGLTYASSGQGGPQHIAGELYAHRIGVKVTHVPYKGESAALSDVLAGHVPYMFANLPVAKPYLDSGKLRALAVTSLQRDDKSPAVPTMAESGFAGFEVLTWYGVFAPARTPGPVMDTLYGSIRAALDDADTRTRLTDQGFTVLGTKPAEFSAFVRDEVPRWSALIGDIGIRPE